MAPGPHITSLFPLVPLAPRLAAGVYRSVVDGLVRGMRTRFVNLPDAGRYPAFVPPWWARAGLAQTVLPMVLGALGLDHARGIVWDPRYVLLADGALCRLDVAWCLGGPEACRGIVVVFHGLAASSDAPYCRAVAHELRRDHTVVIFNRRAHVPESRSDAAPTHYDREDIALVLAHVHTHLACRGRVPMFGFGVSGGANQLVCYAGDSAERCLFRRAMACGNGWDYDHATDNVGSDALERALCVMSDSSVLPNVSGACGAAARGNASVRELDWRAQGLGSRDDLPAYYASVSAIAFVDRVTIPLLCLDALDDPLYVYPHMHELHGRNANISFVVTTHGGHVGWLDDEGGSYFARVLRIWLETPSPSS